MGHLYCLTNVRKVKARYRTVSVLSVEKRSQQKKKKERTKTLQQKKKIIDAIVKNSATGRIKPQREDQLFIREHRFSDISYLEK